MPTSYIVRNLSHQESRDFQQALRRARNEGRSMRWITARLVRLYARVGLDTLEHRAMMKIR